MSILYCPRTPSPYNKIPDEFASELELVLKQAFGRVGMAINDGYFTEGNPMHPKNLSFFVLAYDLNDYRDADKLLVGGSIFTREQIDDFVIEYACKVGVRDGYERNGIMGGIISVAREVSDGKKKHPIVLRTSIPSADAAYSKVSDKHEEVGDFAVHGFGFSDKKTGRELFDGANEKFMTAAKYVALKPKTVVPAEPLMPY